jgi:hypothetical protein
LSILTAFAGTVIGSVAYMLIGKEPLPATFPLFAVVRQQPVLSFTVGAVLLLVTAAALLLVYAPDLWLPQASPPRRSASGSAKRQLSNTLLALTTGLSTISSATVVGLIVVILSHPAWCPQALCFQPPAPHDENLEVGLTAIESATYEIPGNPAQYTLNHLPSSTDGTAIAVQRIVSSSMQGPVQPLRFVLRVHSLQRSGPGMFIEDVVLLVRHADPLPDQLHIWLKGAPLDYQSNPYQVTYEGEPASARLVATYAGPVRGGHVQLAPGESDELDIAVASTTTRELKLQVQVEYRVSDQLVLRTLLLPYLFDVVFADAVHWQQYQLANGRFAPA